METHEILRTLREKKNLTQDQLAERVMVTRQSVVGKTGKLSRIRIHLNFCHESLMYQSIRFLVLQDS